MCSTISYHLYFSVYLKSLSMLHHMSLGQLNNSKECYFMFPDTFLAFFNVFHQKFFVFIIFISFFDEVWNFHNRILTNRKPEMVIRNCQMINYKLGCNFSLCKSVSIRSLSSPNFPAIGLNTEIYRVYLRIQLECGKIRTRKTPNMDIFCAVFFTLDYVQR